MSWPSRLPVFDCWTDQGESRIAWTCQAANVKAAAKLFRAACGLPDVAVWVRGADGVLRFHPAPRPRRASSCS
jgi:hypothetical protein